MSRTLLIPSAQFVQPNMQTEFGRTPPVLLPLRTGVLLDEQMRHLVDVPAQKLLSLPAGYEPEPWARQKFRDYDLTVVPTPEHLSLGQSVLHALREAPEPVSQVRILHGDTLITDLDLGPGDVVSMHAPTSPGLWAQVHDDAAHAYDTAFVDDTDDLALSGYFSFDDAQFFRRAVDEADGDFVTAVDRYRSARGLAQADVGRWYDFGRLDTYFRSRREFTAERHFNNLSFARHSVRKSSALKDKINAEANWFEQLPRALSLYAPRLLSRGESGDTANYEIEYVPQCALNELFVFSALPIQQWRRVAESCVEFLVACRAHTGDPRADLNSLYDRKSRERLAAYCDAAGLEADHPWIVNGENVGSLNDALESASAALGAPGDAVVMHGDFCFSNILFDSRSGVVRAIDPRGGVDIAAPSVFGDGRYDVGKLHHSFAGGYDLILAGRHRLVEHEPYCADLEIDFSPRQKSVGELFQTALERAGLCDARTSAAVSVHLFLSMAPLHADRPDRQRAFTVNALRLARELFQIQPRADRRPRNL